MGDGLAEEGESLAAQRNPLCYGLPRQAAASSSSFVNLLCCMAPIVAQGYARLLVSDASRQIRHVCTYSLNSSGTKFHWCYKAPSQHNLRCTKESLWRVPSLTVWL